MPLSRLLTNVLSNDLDASKKFYMSLFDFDLSFDSDWFVHLTKGQLELGIVAQSHEIVPERAKGQSAGHYLTLVVEDMDSVQSKAVTSDYYILQQPQPTPYGQIRMIVVAPEGTICDISMPVSK